MLRKIRGQSTAEYAIIIAVVIGAAVAMQVYVKRGLQARQKGAVDAFTGITTTIPKILSTGTDATFAGPVQYEPYYLKQSYDRYQENVEQEHMGSGKVQKEKVSDLQATAGGGYQKQEAVSKAERENRDKVWTQ
jgi:hypothetical protein